MKTKLAIALAALLSTSAMAHDYGHNNKNSCNVSLEQSVKVTPAYIQVLDGEKSLFRITDDSQLYAQGKQVHLTDDQKKIVDEYRQLIQELAPQVAQLVNDGVELARDAVTEVFGQLFGEDTKMQAKVEVIIAKFEQRIKPMINENKGEYYLSKESIDNAGDDLGDEIEHEIESMMTESVGHIFTLIGKLLTSGKDGMKDFEKKMEAFGERMELRSEDLERQSELMCAQFEKLEKIESRMQKEISAVADFDLVKLSKT